MYKTEEINDRTAMKDYLKNYVSGMSFLEYCEKCMGYRQIWSCPLYDFDPVEYGRKYKYFHIIGRRITFETAAEVKERGEYMSRVCLEEKDILLEKIQALESKYPGSVGLSAGSCDVCSRCRKSKGKGCRYPEEIRGFIESLGGHAGETAGELLGIELQWMREKPPESCTLISGLLTDHPKLEI
jgi:predicted metal-binding protein